MDNVCIKGVNKKDWLYFKSEAAKSDKTMGEFFSTMVLKYKEAPRSNWDKIMSHKPLLTRAEAEDMKRYIADSFSKETEF